MGLQQHIEECKKEIQSFMANNKSLQIKYVRRFSCPKREIAVSKHQVNAIYGLLDVTGNRLSTKAYLRILKILLPEIEWTTEEQFRVIKQEWKSRRSAKRGVVVAYENQGQIFVGWSLCHPMDKQKWNRHIGVKKAISTAVSLKIFSDDHISGEIEVPQLVLATLKRMLSNKLFEVAKNEVQQLIDLT